VRQPGRCPLVPLPRCPACLRRQIRRQGIRIVDSVSWHAHPSPDFN
jgi:hypothetical protein